MAEIARERGVDPVEAMLDLAIEKDLERFFVHPVAVVTFSDSGAHVSQIIDSSLQIHLLSHWVRERQAFTLEQAVRMLTWSRPLTGGSATAASCARAAWPTCSRSTPTRSPPKCRK